MLKSLFYRWVDWELRFVERVELSYFSKTLSQWNGEAMLQTQAIYCYFNPYISMNNFNDDEISTLMILFHFEDWERNKSISEIKSRCVLFHHSFFSSNNFSGYLVVRHCSRILGYKYRKKKIILAFKVSCNPCTVALLG